MEMFIISACDVLSITRVAVDLAKKMTHLSNVCRQYEDLNDSAKELLEKIEEFRNLEHQFGSYPGLTNRENRCSSRSHVVDDLDSASSGKNAIFKFMAGSFRAFQALEHRMRRLPSFINSFAEARARSHLRSAGRIEPDLRNPSMNALKFTLDQIGSFTEIASHHQDLFAFGPEESEFDLIWGCIEYGEGSKKPCNALDDFSDGHSAWNQARMPWEMWEQFLPDSMFKSA